MKDELEQMRQMEFRVRVSVCVMGLARRFNQQIVAASYDQ